MPNTTKSRPMRINRHRWALKVNRRQNLSNRPVRNLHNKQKDLLSIRRRRRLRIWLIRARRWYINIRPRSPWIRIKWTITMRKNPPKPKMKAKSHQMRHLRGSNWWMCETATPKTTWTQRLSSNQNRKAYWSTPRSRYEETTWPKEWARNFKTRIWTRSILTALEMSYQRSR